MAGAGVAVCVHMAGAGVAECVHVAGLACSEEGHTSSCLTHAGLERRPLLPPPPHRLCELTKGLDPASRKPHN